MKKFLVFVLGAIATAFLFAYVSPLYAVRGIVPVMGILVTWNHVAALLGGTLAAAKLGGK